MRLLITGGSGFIGTNAIEYFKKTNEVLNIDKKKPQNVEHHKYWEKCDITDLNNYNKIVSDFNPVYFLHLAARTDLNQDEDINGYAANIEGVSNTINVIKNCRSVKKAIFASSRMVCRIAYQPKSDNDYCPPNLYGESKVIGEKLVRGANIDCEWILVRPTSIWGPWFDVPYKIFFTTMKKGLYFNPGNYNPQKSFGFVGNTVYQLGRLFKVSWNLINKKTFYLCDYPPLRLREWAEVIKNEMQSKPIPTIPFSFLKAVALIGDQLYKGGWYRVPLTSFRLNNLITDMVYDYSLIEDVCGELPYSLEDGVKKTVQWMESRGDKLFWHGINK